LENFYHNAQTAAFCKAINLKNHSITTIKVHTCITSDNNFTILHPGQLSLAIPPWIGAMTTGDGYEFTTTARKEHGEFCVVVAPATRTAGILTQLVKGAGC